MRSILGPYCLYKLKNLGLDFSKSPVLPMQHYNLKNEYVGSIWSIEDPSHVLKRLAKHVFESGITGFVLKNAWINLAKLNKKCFKMEWYERDPQIVPVALQFFSLDVENSLKSLRVKQNFVMQQENYGLFMMTKTWKLNRA